MLFTPKIVKTKRGYENSPGSSNEQKGYKSATNAKTPSLVRRENGCKVGHMKLNFSEKDTIHHLQPLNPRLAGM